MDSNNDDDAIGRHFILVVPTTCGKVPLAALVAALCFRASRQDDQPADWTAIERSDDQEEEENFLENFNSILHQALRHRSSELSSSCDVVLVYLDTAPSTEAEVSLLRWAGTAGGLRVVHVFGQCPQEVARALACMRHVRLHSGADSLAAADVWRSCRRQVPKDLRAAIAVARLNRFGASCRLLAESEDLDCLLETARSTLPSSLSHDPDIVSSCLLDHLEAQVPMIEEQLDAEKLAAAGEAVKTAIDKIEQGQDALVDTVQRIISLQQQLSSRLSTSQLVSVRLSGLCGGKFGGLLLADGLDTDNIGHCGRVLIQQQMIIKSARFAAVVGTASPQSDVRTIRCFRLDEADDCREVIRGLLRLCGSREPPLGAPWDAVGTLDGEQLEQLRLRLQLAQEFGAE